MPNVIDIEQRLTELEKQVASLNTAIKIAVGIAIVFGIAGGFGWSVLNSASTKVGAMVKDIDALDKRVETLHKELPPLADVAVANAIAKNEVGKRMIIIESDYKDMKMQGSPVQSVLKVPEGHGMILKAQCQDGQAMQGLELKLGGTCQGQCDPTDDGRPVISYAALCAKK